MGFVSDVLDKVDDCAELKFASNVCKIVEDVKNNNNTDKKN